MRLKLYRAPEVADAMAQVRAELGPDAIIVATRPVREGVEVTVALDLPPAEPPASPAPPPLAWHGVPEALAARLRPPLAPALAATFRFETLPVGGPPLLLAGTPGAGKTTTIARLATRLVLAGQRPAVLTADGRRAGAAEELAAYTRLLGIPLTVANRPETLARALRRPELAGPVLIDTAGVNPRDPAEMETLSALAAASGAVMAVVMPAGQHAEEAAEYAAAFAAIGARHLVATRLDVGRRLGNLLAACHRGDLAFTEASTGPGIAERLVELTPAELAVRLA